MATSGTNPGSKELFRYARIFSPAILDLNARLQKYSEFREINGSSGNAAGKKKSGTSKNWAKGFLTSKSYVRSPESVDFDIFKYLKINKIPDDFLPDHTCIRDKEAFRHYKPETDPGYHTALKNISLSLYAAIKLGDKPEINRLSRLLHFTEHLPNLSSAIKKQPYAPVITRRYKDKAAVPGRSDRENAGLRSSGPIAEDKGKDILALWDALNAYHIWKNHELDTRIRLIKNEKFSFIADKTTKTKQSASAVREKQQRRNDAYKKYISNKNAGIKEVKSIREEFSKLSFRQKIAGMEKDKDFVKYYEKVIGIDLNSVVSHISEKDRNNSSISEVYREEKNKHNYRPDRSDPCITSEENPCFDLLRKDAHKLKDSDDIRPLGLANLITVEENWIKYTPGEIGSVENILKGEIRKKEVKSTKYFEEVVEQTRLEEEEKEKESKSEVQQELSSSIENEISTRFESDINASVSGSGGGSIGVVDFSGAGSLGTSIGLGMDSSLSTSSESVFSQEIISKAVEKTKKLNSERRLSRTYSLFETTNYHEINNTGNGAAHTNAVYCYLDKHICITERVYGIRKFLVADLVYPGDELIRNQLQRHILNLNEVGLPPHFDISPEEINPSNYLALAGKYRASNITPPPPAVKMVSRTYKTDTTNENKEQNELKFKKITEILAPFFGEYKRFLIQDNIEIPEGYMVQEVWVTVTHGSNGVSIPAHLPFSLLGAAIYALPVIGAAAIPPYTLFYLPMAIWQVLYTASPLLHYNSDSSNVTINIAHQTHESPYFFFQPDFLIKEVFEALGSSSILTEDFIDFLKTKIEVLYNDITSVDNNELINSLSGLSGELLTSVTAFITELQTWLGNLIVDIPAIVTGGGTSSSPVFPQLNSVSATTLAAIPEAIIKPFKDFFETIVDHLEELMQSVLGDFLEYINTMIDNTDTRKFENLKGIVETLPISFNCIALKPGITINLSVTMVRIDELALDKWRLETFESLNHAYYQLEADYQSKVVMNSDRKTVRNSPGLMREEEQRVIKTRIIEAMHAKYHSTPNHPISLNELKLFENAIDWKNISFKLHNYGPKGIHVMLEKMGLFDTADQRRETFMKALWAQVLLPLQEDIRLEQIMINYLETGNIDFEADLLAQIDESGEEALNELTVIYRDLILQREKIPLVEPVYRKEIIPTDLMVIYQEQEDKPFPVNELECPIDE